MALEPFYSRTQQQRQQREANSNVMAERAGLGWMPGTAAYLAGSRPSVYPAVPLEGAAYRARHHHEAAACGPALPSSRPSLQRRRWPLPYRAVALEVAAFRAHRPGAEAPAGDRSWVDSDPRGVLLALPTPPWKGFAAVQAAASSSNFVSGDFHYWFSKLTQAKKGDLHGKS